MAPLTAQFSASVACRDQVVRKTWVGSTVASARRTLAASRRSAATGRTPAGAVSGWRARPWTVQPPASSRCSARLRPAMPVTPTISAVGAMVSFPGPPAAGRSSAGEARLRHAADAEVVDREERAAQRRVGREARQRRLGHRGDVEHVEVRAAEVHARHLLDRHVDHPVDAAVRRVADQLAGVDDGAPDAALGVDCGPVEGAALVRHPGEGALVRDAAGLEVVVVGRDLARPGIGEVEGAPVRAPARAVADDDPALGPGALEVGVEPVEGAVRPLLHRVHRAGHEPAALVDLAVVDPVVRPVRLRVVDQLELARPEVEEVPAAGERDHGTAALPQAHRADLLRHVPGADLAAVRGAAEHPAVEAVDPVEPLLLHVPERTLAEGRLDVDQDLDAHGAPPSSRYPLKRGSGTPRTPSPWTANRPPASRSCRRRPWKG